MSEEKNEPGREVAPIGKPALPSFSLTPKSLEEAMKLAELMAKSDLVPKDFRDKPGNVLVAVQMGAEVGLAPMQAMQSIAVINGRPTIWGDAVLALVQGSGLLEWIKETDDGETATCAAKRVGYPDPTVRTFSMADAKAAGLAGKQGPWGQYPKRMRQMRARAFALRDGFSDVLRGLAVREEIEDYDFLNARNVTPERPESLMPQSKSETTESIPAERTVDTTEGHREPGSDDKVRFEIQGRHYETDGITREQMLESFRLAPIVDLRCGKNHAAKVLINDFKLGSRNELTAETAAQYLARLQQDAGEQPAEDASS